MAFIYLATPYSKYKHGLEAANALASTYAAEFIKHKFPVFCPIAHSHSISVHGDLAAKNHDIWMPLDFAFCDCAFALVVALIVGWNESYGVKKEIEFFERAGKPIYYWAPPVLDNQLLLRDLQRDWARDKRKRENIQSYNTVYDV